MVNSCDPCIRAKSTCESCDPASKPFTRAVCQGCWKEEIQCVRRPKHRLAASSFEFSHGNETDTSGVEERDFVKYFYQEDAYECRSAWAPLYVRKQLQTIFGSPQSPNLYTSWENASTERRLTDFAVKSIQQCWEEYKTGVEYYTRPEFEAEEKVWTCRRICSLFGRLQPTASPPIEVGTYLLRWRIQFFDTRQNSLDVYDSIDHMEAIEQISGTAVFGANLSNPLLYPEWPGQLTDYPAFPSLVLSAGYLRDEFKEDAKNFSKVNEKLRKGPGSPQIADQLLCPPDEKTGKTRNIHYVKPNTEHLPNRDKGWVFIDSKELFEVKAKAKSQLVFLVTNIDTGWWQGGFRFGGVDLVSMVQNPALRGSKRKGPG